MDTRVTNTVVDGGVGEGDAAGRRLGAVRDGRHGEGGLVQEAVAEDVEVLEEAVGALAQRVDGLDVVVGEVLGRVPVVLHHDVVGHDDVVVRVDSGELDLVAGLAHVAEVAEEDGDGVGGRDHGAVQGVGLIGSDAGVDARRRS